MRKGRGNISNLDRSHNDEQTPNINRLDTTAISRDYILYDDDANIEANKLNDLGIKLNTYNSIDNNDLSIQWGKVKIITKLNNTKKTI